MSRWNGKFFKDAAERVGSAAVAGVTTMIIGDGSGTISGSGKQWWLIVGLPSALVALKCLASNLGSGTDGAPSASLVKVSSNET